MKNYVFKIMLLAIICFSTPISANPNYWGGCLDAIGRPVPDIANYWLNDIAVSHLDYSGNPIIEFNPNIVANVSIATHRFFYLHECAHHALGQIVSGTPSSFFSEQQADCWAINMMKRQGLSSSEFNSIQNHLFSLPGDSSHFHGYIRAPNLAQCK